MKIKKNFKLRTVMGQAFVIAEGADAANFNKIISLNPSATLLWQAAEGKDFTNADLAKVLVEHYDVDESQALEDVDEIVDRWVETGLVER